MVKVRPARLRQTIKKPLYVAEKNDSGSDSEPRISSSDSNASDVEEIAEEMLSASESLTVDDSIAEEMAGLIAEQAGELEGDEVLPEPKKGRKKSREQKPMELTDELDTPASQKSQRRVKLRLNDSSTTDKNNVKPANVIDYLTFVQNAYTNFYDNFQKQGPSPTVAACRPEVQSRWKKSEDIKDALEKWLNQKSIGFMLSSQAAAVEVIPIPVDPNETPVKLGRPRKGEEVVAREKRPRRPKKKKVIIRSTSPEQKPVINESTSLDSLSIFHATTFDFQHVSSAYRTESNQVIDFVNELKKRVSEDGQTPSGSKLQAEVSKLKKRRHLNQLAFCGGPISAIRTCPRRTSNNNELVVISTFADERMLSLSEEAAYVQFWSFPSDLSSVSKLEFILEIPDVSAVLTMCWCPVLNEKTKLNSTSAKETMPSKSSRSASSGYSKRRKLSKSVEEEEDDVLGLLAVGTNIGKVMVYCIPRNIESVTKMRESRDRNVSDEDETSCPLVVSVKPVFVLDHPTIAMKVLADENQEVFLKKTPKIKKIKTESEEADEVLPKVESFVDVCRFPILSVDWSPFSGGRLIACVSAAGRILVWDVEAEPRNCPLIIYSSEWNSPPVNAVWMTETRVAVSFRSKSLRIFDVCSEVCLHENTTPRTVGTLVSSCPSILPGLFCYDTVPINMFNILYTCSGYLTFDDDTLEKSLVVPTFNSHQVQAMRSMVCENSGVIGSVGADGRVIFTLNGRVRPHDAPGDFSFITARTQLQVIGHRIEHADKKASLNGNFGGGIDSGEKTLTKPCFSHDDCRAHKWLEIRCGDAAMRDMITMRRCKTKLPEPSDAWTGYSGRRSWINLHFAMHALENYMNRILS
uniref:WD repeat-containing protein 60 n=1 Tax=Ditylenchus dipsaci TaxID=166011 RepID=A0A915EN91_9BILA